MLDEKRPASAGRRTPYFDNPMSVRAIAGVRLYSCATRRAGEHEQRLDIDSRTCYEWNVKTLLAGQQGGSDGEGPGSEGMLDGRWQMADGGTPSSQVICA